MKIGSSIIEHHSLQTALNLTRISTGSSFRISKTISSGRRIGDDDDDAIFPLFFSISYCCSNGFGYGE
ncbi:hypothetical protein LguiB_012566 [Lonicera macranthoides]